MSIHSISKQGERNAIFILCLVGAIHVYIYCTAFPFFGSVDEQAHIDLTARYSSGEIPRSLNRVSEKALPFFAIYGTMEYFALLNPHAGDKSSPPLWKQPIKDAQSQIALNAFLYRQGFQNSESVSPPLYYALGGIWWQVGELLGFNGIGFLYWLRFLNILLIALTVWLAWQTAEFLWPDNQFPRLALPALVALLPQSSFYFVDNDILQPITFGAAFLLMLKFFEAETPSFKLAAATGFALALTFLSKSSTLPLVAVAVALLAFNIFQRAGQGKLRPVTAPFIMLGFCAALPIATWMAWCKMNFGDPLGAGAKSQAMGWTPKPFLDWFHHPIFTGPGFWYFLNRNIGTVWQGEMVWHTRRLANPVVDIVYLVITLGPLLVTLVALIRSPSQFSSKLRMAIPFALMCFVASLLFLALLSVKYDFHDCQYPSRAQPFFVSGRLMLGMLLPLLVLVVIGLDKLTNSFGIIGKYAVILCLLGFMVTTEIFMNYPVFGSLYNWYH